MTLMVDIVEVLRVLKKQKLKFVTIIIASLASFGASFITEHKLEKERQANLVYHKQIAALDSVDKSIQDLKEFVSQQKQQLRESQDIVNTLKTEEQKLRPVVQADREVVNAILDAQARQQRANIWKDRIIAFALGVLASLIASAIISAMRQVSARKKEAETYL